MFGNVKNYSDLCWRKDCHGRAWNPGKETYKNSHLLSFLSIGSKRDLPERVESHKIALRGFPFGAFLLAQGHRCYLTERVSTGRLYNPNPTSNLAICIGIKEVQALCHSHPATSN